MVEHPPPIEVFLSYAPEDKEWVQRLLTHLSLLQRQQMISTWYDRVIAPGTDWAKDINHHLEEASIILFLVSANFLASDYCYQVEMTRALERDRLGQARVIPIALRPVDWSIAPFAYLQALPSDARPITTWSDHDEALVDVVAGIRRAIEDLSFSPASSVRHDLPTIWNIPYSRNSFFLGRNAVLEQLHANLHQGLPMALSQSRHALSGLGGIGKTQLAVEYAYRYHQDYEAVLWARAESEEALRSAYFTLATLLKLPECNAEKQEIIITAVKGWLQTHQKWLLILDNADDLDVVPPFLPPTAGGHILLTTREQDMQNLATRLEVETFSNEQGAIFLLWRAGRIASESEWEQLSHEDRESSLRLAYKLGGLPLALDQAGAYLEATGAEVREYLKIYQTHRNALLRQRRSRTQDHPEAVATTWLLSFQHLQARNPAAADLLRLCAYLAPDAIAEELLTTDPSVLGPILAPVASDLFELMQAIEALLASSLIRRNRAEKTLSVHRLVQAVLQDSMEEAERLLWAERAMLAINAAFPHPVHETWEQCERLLTQALAGVRIIQVYQITSKEAARLLYECASYLQDRTRYTEAESLYQHALHIREQVLGPEHLEAASPLSGLADLYREQGKYAEAEPLYRRALHIWEQALGPEHPQVAVSLYGLAVLYRERGKYAEVEPLYRRALHIWEQALGPEHPQVAYLLNGLAVLYAEQGKYAEAEPLYRRALHIREQALGPKHVEVAHPLNNLANLYVAQGKYAEAEPLHQRALHIREQALGPEHPQVAFSLNNLAKLYQEQGKYAEAEPLYQRALHICEQALGSEHAHTKQVRDNYDHLLQAMKRNVEVRKLEKLE